MKRSIPLNRKRLRNLIREEKRLMQEKRDYTSQLKFVRSLTLSQLEAGKFVRIPYTTDDGDYRYRTGIIVDPNAGHPFKKGSDSGYLHILDIGKLREEQIYKLFAHITRRLSPGAQRMMDEMFPGVLQTGPIKEDENFYYDIIKATGLQNDAYRTLRRDKVAYDEIKEVKFYPSLSSKKADVEGIELQDYYTL